MSLLTPGEYDDLPDEAKAELAAVRRQPRRDKKNISFRKRRGREQNGEVDASIEALSTTGYGTGRPQRPNPWLGG